MKKIFLNLLDNVTNFININYISSGHNNDSELTDEKL